MNVTRRAAPGTARTAAGTVIAAACVLAAGCGTKAAANPGPAPIPAAPPLATSFTSSAGAGRAIVEMGGPAAQQDNFWELFVRPAGAARWRLATPAGVADNGGLDVAGTGGSLVTGFRPSQDLTFSPLATSGDGGTSWSPASPVTPGLADAPDALASGAGGRVIALTGRGTAELGTGGGTTWTRLASAAALAATPAGKACGVGGLTAAAFGGSGVPMLAANCSRTGIAGLFADRGGSWQAAGPAVPGSLAGKKINVVRLTAAGGGVVALLRAGSGADTSLMAAWPDGGGRAWTLSAPLRIGSAPLRATSFGPGKTAGVILNGGHGATLAGPGSSWRVLPALPAWAAALALGPGGTVDALTAHASTFADWRLGPHGSGPGTGGSGPAGPGPAGSGTSGSGPSGSGTSGSGTGGPGPAGWSLVQTIRVSIPYGSSG